MSIIDWFKSLLATEAKHYVFAQIPSDIDEIEFKEGQHYFRLRLAEMFLKDDRKLFHEYVPVVSSAVQLQFGSKQPQTLRNMELKHPLFLSLVKLLLCVSSWLGLINDCYLEKLHWLLGLESRQVP